ncbi:MAG: response regulator [Deltaproteobacteria bacterium]|nr:response regulator [Deltaproteobacteria bacterium]
MIPKPTYEELEQKAEDLEKKMFDLMQAGEALRESEIQKQALLDSSPDVVIQIDTNMRVLWANKMALNMNPYIIGRTCYKGYVGRDNPCEGCPCRKAIETGNIEANVMYQPVMEGVQGESYWEDIGVPLKDGANEVVGVIEFARNITDRKQAEDVLRKSEAQKKAILDGITINMMFVNKNMETIWVNRAAAASANISPEDMVGHRCYEFWGDGSKKPWDGCPAMKVFRAKKTAQAIRHTSDGKVWDLRADPVFNEKGNLAGVINLAYDITSKLRLEDQLKRAEKMEAIGTLAGGVAHDLNNILCSFVGYPDLLLMEIPEESPLRKPILTIQQSGQRAAAVVQDLLSLARRGVVATEVVNLNQVINSYLSSPEHKELKKFYPDTKIESDLETNLFNVMGSPVHLSKSIKNLVFNAAEAMPDGGKIFISTQSKYIDKPIRGYVDVKEGDYVILTVSDNGTGISSEAMEKIFEPFYTKKVMGRSGTGLGMAVVWGITEDHKGYIDVQGAPGKGTTFTLYFPVTRKEISGKEKVLPMEEYMGKGESILVVDDVKEQRQIVSRILKKLGYSVTTVSSGEEAVDYLKDNSADLLILDMIMDPGIDGLETYKRIVEFRPRQKALIVSGFSETERVKEAQGLGAGEYVKKPFLLEKIGMAARAELDK